MIKCQENALEVKDDLQAFGLVVSCRFRLRLRFDDDVKCHDLKLKGFR